MEPGSGADHRTIPEQASDERPGESRATGMAKAMEKEVSWTSEAWRSSLWSRGRTPERRHRISGAALAPKGRAPEGQLAVTAQRRSAMPDRLYSSPSPST